MSKKKGNKLKGTMAKMMLSCDESTLLISKAEEEKLKCKEKFDLKLHLMACHLCRTYKNQSAIFRSKINDLKKDIDMGSLNLKLSDKKKKEIKKILKEQKD